MKVRFWTSDGTGKKVPRFFRCDKILSFFPSEGRVNTRQLGFFPLATTSVGWVPDQHTRRAKAKRRTRSVAESCAGGLPTENGAQGEALVLIDRIVISRRGCDYTKEDATNYRRGYD